MSIASLSTISLSHFAGNAHVAEAGSSGLAQILLTLQEKVNEVIEGLTDGSITELLVGVAADGTYYGGSNDSFFQVDGTNPPRVYKLEILDATDGTWAALTVAGGVGAHVLSLDGTPV